MPSAITALATLTLSSAQATVTFSSISGSFRDLRFVITPANGSSEDLKLQFNNDTGDNYSAVYVSGNGSGAASSYNSGAASMNVDFTVNMTSAGNITTLDVLDYSATNKHKSTLIRGNDAARGSEAIAGRWASTTAVTSAKFFLTGAASFSAGSTFTLYGVSA